MSSRWAAPKGARIRDRCPRGAPLCPLRSAPGGLAAQAEPAGPGARRRAGEVVSRGRAARVRRSVAPRAVSPPRSRPEAGAASPGPRAEAASSLRSRPRRRSRLRPAARSTGSAGPLSPTLRGRRSGCAPASRAGCERPHRSPHERTPRFAAAGRVWDRRCASAPPRARPRKDGAWRGRPTAHGRRHPPAVPPRGSRRAPSREPRAHQGSASRSPTPACSRRVVAR